MTYDSGMQTLIESDLHTAGTDHTKIGPVNSGSDNECAKKNSRQRYTTGTWYGNSESDRYTGTCFRTQ